MTPNKSVLLLLFRVLVLKLGLGLRNTVYDDTAIVGHVRIPIEKSKLSTQFDGPISHNLKRQLPTAFVDVVEIRLPEGASTFPMLSGVASVKSQKYRWTLDPLCYTLIVRAIDGTIKNT